MTIEFTTMRLQVPFVQRETQQGMAETKQPRGPISQTGAEQSGRDGHSHVGVHQLLKNWKQAITKPNLRVELDDQTPLNNIWLNLIDNDTGRVVMRFPPEAIRLLAQHGQSTGLITDLHR